MQRPAAYYFGVIGRVLHSGAQAFPCERFVEGHIAQLCKIENVGRLAKRLGCFEVLAANPALPQAALEAARGRERDLPPGGAILHDDLAVLQSDIVHLSKALRHARVEQEEAR